MWYILPETKFGKHHPAPFPEKLAYRLIKFYTYKNDIVLDMFGGSGSVPVIYLKKEIERQGIIYVGNNLNNYISFEKAENYVNKIKKKGNDRVGKYS